MDGVGSILNGAIDAGATLLVVLSWHVENANVLWDAVRAVLPSESARAILFAAPWELLDASVVRRLVKSVQQIDWNSDHAGILETALMLHLAPDLVGPIPTPSSGAPPPFDVLPTPASAAPVGGLINDATGASAALGRDSFESMVSSMARAVLGVRRDG